MCESVRMLYDDTLFDETESDLRGRCVLELELATEIIGRLGRYRLLALDSYL
jgi:hypothetical protein